MSEAKESALFSHFQYYVAGKISPEAKDILDKDGAKCSTYLNELVKIAITDTTENEDEYAEISDIYDIPVVSCSWVVLSHKCGKLLPTKAFPPGQTSTALFRDKVFSASHMDRADLSSLWAMITFHGGLAQRAVTGKVTHFLCTNTSGKKYSLSQRFAEIKVVTPDWVVECIKLKTLVNEVVYHPRLLISSPALRKQLLSPPVASPAEPNWGLGPRVRTPKTTSAPHMRSPFPGPTFPTISDGTASPQIPSYTNTPSVPRRMPPPPPTTTTRSSMHELPSGFPPGYSQDPRFPPQHHMMPPMMGSQLPRHRQMSPHFADQNYMAHGAYGLPPGMPEQPHPSKHPQTGRAMNRPFLKATSPMPPHSGVDGLGYAPIHYTGATARQSPVSPSMMGLRHPHPLNPTNQRSSPSNRKTPPMLNLGHMTEVPFPSQASLPEETPIIRMTNMAAFPMGSEIVSTTQRKSPVASGRTTPRNQSHAAAASHSPHSMPQSKSPVSAHPFTNVSVIKQTKSADSRSHNPCSADRSPASSVTRLTPPVTVAGSRLTPPVTGAGSRLTPPVTGAGSRLTPPVSAMAAHGTSTGDNTDTPVVYYGYDSNETLPNGMSLAGCIFYMGEYLKTDPCEQWIKAIEENGGTVDPSYSNRVTHVLVETQASDACRLALNDHKRVVTAHWLNDVIGSRRMEPPWRAHHLPHPHSSDNQLCANQVIGITGFSREERRILHVMVQMIGASFTNYLARSNTVLVCKRLEGEKVKKAGEWGVECVNVQWLSEIVVGNLRALKLPIDKKYKVFGKSDDFLIEQSLAAVIMSGWRVPLKVPKDNCRKFKPSTKSADSAWENKRKVEGEMFINPTKRLRLQEIQNTSSNLPAGQRPFVLLTGFSKAERNKYAEMVKSLGGVVCEDVKQCTHIIAEKVLRTPNFLLAINYCSYISSSEWIMESIKSGHFVDERVFTLQNSEAGSMWNILEALDKRNTHGKPFTGLLFHITPGVALSTSLSRQFLCELITAAGGSIQPAKEKRWSIRKIAENLQGSHNGKSTYIVVACKDDIHICMDMLRSNQEVYSVEFILSGVMNQFPPYEAVLCTREP